MTLRKTDAEIGEAEVWQSPQEVMAQATEQANALIEVVEKQHLYQKIGTKRYLEAEAWETILAYNQANPVPEWVRPMTDQEGHVTGYIARVNIIKKGQVIAAGEMPCGFDDFPCRGKEGTAKHKAAMSAAQTWALSKAARMKYAWVVVLAGFQPTPAEEVVQDEGPAVAPERRPGATPARVVRGFDPTDKDMGAILNQLIQVEKLAKTRAEIAGMCGILEKDLSTQQPVWVYQTVQAFTR